MDHVYGSGSWSTVKRKNAKGEVYTYHRLRVSLGNKRFKEFLGKTKTEAQRKYKAWLTQKGEGGKRVASTVAEVARIAVEARKDQIKETTYDFYLYGVLALEEGLTIGKNDNNEFIKKKSRLGQMQIKAITTEDLQDYINELKDYTTMSTIKRQRIVLKITFDYAENMGFIETNPMLKVKLPNEAKVAKAEREPVFLTVDQRKRLEVEAVRKNGDDGISRSTKGTRFYGVTADVLVFILHTGLRLGEVRALTWKNVDKRAGFIHVKENAPTSGKSTTTPKRKSSIRKIPIDKTAREVLDRQKKNGDYVFHSSSGKMVDGSHVERTLDSMVKRCGLLDEGVKPVPHDLRHTFASELIAKGADIKTVSEILGHSDVSTTLNIYVHTSKDAYEKVRGLID